MHIVEGLVDAAEILAVRDELVHLELAVHIVGDQAGHLCSAFDAAEGTAFPSTASDQLEGYAQSQLILKRRKINEYVRLVAISCPAAATPMMMLSPQPL
jgi:hypothetical protein